MLGREVSSSVLMSKGWWLGKDYGAYLGLSLPRANDFGPWTVTISHTVSQNDSESQD